MNKRKRMFHTVAEIEAAFLPRKTREEREAEEARQSGGTGCVPAFLREIRKSFRKARLKGEKGGG